MNERKSAGANYIISYFNEVQQLKVIYAQYINFLLELKTKYHNENLDKLEEIERGQLSQLAQGVRHLVHLTYISYASIFSIDKLKVDKKIAELYYKIANTYIINTKELEQYVTEINRSLVLDIVKDLLTSSQDVVNDLYKNE